MSPDSQAINRFLETQNLETAFNADTGSFVLCMIIALLFGLMLKTLYSVYFLENEPQDASLSRSLVILTPALSASFWMIQHSLILSLGLLGSLSFVRFRTPVKRAEDVSFIVVMLATALSCAIELYVFGAVLILLLFAYSLGRNYFGKFFFSKDKFAIITFNTRKSDCASTVKDILNTIKVNPSFVSARTYDGISSLVFNATRVSKVSHDQITSKLTEFDPEAHINIFYPNDRLGV